MGRNQSRRGDHPGNSNRSRAGGDHSDARKAPFRSSLESEILASAEIVAARVNIANASHNGKARMRINGIGEKSPVLIYFSGHLSSIMKRAWSGGALATTWSAKRLRTSITQTRTRIKDKPALNGSSVSVGKLSYNDLS